MYGRLRPRALLSASCLYSPENLAYLVVNIIVIHQPITSKRPLIQMLYFIYLQARLVLTCVSLSQWFSKVGEAPSLLLLCSLSLHRLGKVLHLVGKLHLPADVCEGLASGLYLRSYYFMVFIQPKPISTCYLHPYGVRDFARTLARYVVSLFSPVDILTALDQIIITWQTRTALGFVISGAIALVVPNSLQFQRYTLFVPALVLLLHVFLGSESPDWLIKKQRYGEAFNILSRLRGNSLLAARDLALSWSQSQTYPRPEVNRQKSGALCRYGRRINQILTVPRVRSLTVAALIVFIARQLSTGNLFALAGSSLFGKVRTDGSSNSTNRNSQWLFLGFGIANFL